MILAVASLVWTCAASSPVVTAVDGLQRAVELVRAGDFQGALRAANDEPDALARDQARVYVLHHAGDLDGALRTAVDALHAHPEDAWLAERLVYIASSLRRVEPAREGLTRLEAAASVASAPDRERWTKLAASAREDIDDMDRAHARADAARTRARGVTLVIGLLGVALLTFLTRGFPAKTRG